MFLFAKTTPIDLPASAADVSDLQHPPMELGPELTELDLNHARLDQIDPGLALCVNIEVCPCG
jgi:hypothetical protein